jgi:hypothetical protein
MPKELMKEEKSLVSELSLPEAQGKSKVIGGKVTIELKAAFELDDARIFDLNGKGLTVAMVTSN